MEEVLVCETESNFIIKHSGYYYPFSFINDRDDLLGIVDDLNMDPTYYSMYSTKVVVEIVSKLDFIHLNEWLILN